MSNQEQDIIILEQLKAGSEQAFATFYAKYRKYLMVAAVSMLEDQMEAQDVVQDFFIDFWQKQLFNRIDPAYNRGDGGPVKGYIHRIIYNRCLDKLSQRKSRQQRIEDMPAPELVCQPENRTENREWQQQLGIALQSAINKVPPMSARVFQLAYIEHKSRQEIATLMGVSPNTVKNQLLRAVKILRSQLKKG
jgi:RNA polymerase sigma-70 factor (ECF subfamily)